MIKTTADMLKSSCLNWVAALLQQLWPAWFQNCKTVLFSDMGSCFISKATMSLPRSPWSVKISFSLKKNSRTFSLPRFNLVTQNASFCWIMSHMVSLSLLCLAPNPQITTQRHLTSPMPSSSGSKKIWTFKLHGVPNVCYAFASLKSYHSLLLTLYRKTTSLELSLGGWERLNSPPLS